MESKKSSNTHLLDGGHDNVLDRLLQGHNLLDVLWRKRTAVTQAVYTAGTDTLSPQALSTHRPHQSQAMSQPRSPQLYQRGHKRVPFCLEMKQSRGGLYGLHSGPTFTVISC